MKFTDKEIAEFKENLCYYDSDSPYYDSESRSNFKKGTCHCDNCFYGRSSMAKTLLVLANQE